MTSSSSVWHILRALLIGTLATYELMANDANGETNLMQYTFSSFLQALVLAVLIVSLPTLFLRIGGS